MTDENKKEEGQEEQTQTEEVVKEEQEEQEEKEETIEEGEEETEQEETSDAEKEEVDDSGISYKNRYMELQRKSQLKLDNLANEVSQLRANMQAPQQPKASVPEPTDPTEKALKPYMDKYVNQIRYQEKMNEADALVRSKDPAKYQENINKVLNKIREFNINMSQDPLLGAKKALELIAQEEELRSFKTKSVVKKKEVVDKDRQEKIKKTKTTGTGKSPIQKTSRIDELKAKVNDPESKPGDVTALIDEMFKKYD